MTTRVPLRRFSFLLLILVLIFTFPLPEETHADSLPESASISGVAGYPQTYSLSCESRSAVDLAAFWGLEIGESDFLSKLPRSNNPSEGFVGYANDPWGYTPPYSYGVHADPVAKLLRKYGLKAEAHHRLRWKDLRREIAAGRPVIVWVIGQMWNGSSRAYTATDGKVVTVAPYEHTMILTGYDSSWVQVVDAYSGRALTYPLDAFLNSWSVLGNMAVFSRGPKEEIPPLTEEPLEENRDTYTVERGDYLVALAGRFNTTWQELVTLNDIAYPYTLLPGQVLQLPKRSQKQEAKPEKDNADQPRQEPEPDDVPETYTVQRGEYLVEIARRFEVEWRTLAQLNGIGYPYVIYTGQILRLK